MTLSIESIFVITEPFFQKFGSPFFQKFGSNLLKFITFVLRNVFIYVILKRTFGHEKEPT
jgi:hypothetical protein